MKIHITRDSVCAADDINPHVGKGSIADDADRDAIVEKSLQLNPLPQIIGGCASWVLSSGVPIAVIAQQWSAPKYFLSATAERKDFDIRDNTLRLRLAYFAQRDPNEVFADLSRPRLAGFEWKWQND